MMFSLAIRNMLRQRRRSMLTALAITFGTGLLTIGIAWQNGVLQGMLEKAAAMAGHVRIVTEDYARKEQLFPISENIADTAPIVEAVSKVPGVTGVYPRLQLPATLTVGEEIGEVFGMVTGAPIPFYTDVLDLDGSLSVGRMMADDKEAVIGLTLADELGAKLGDELIALGQTQDGSISPIKVTIVGLYDMGGGNVNKMVYVTLDKARWMADIPDGATEVVVFTDDRDRSEAIAAAAAGLPETKGLEVKAWSQRPPWAEMMGLQTTIQFIIVAVIVIISALVVLNTMLMSVLERTAEIGVMRAMGLRRWQTLGLFMTEALVIASIGGVGGAILGAGGGLLLEQRGINLGSAVDKLPSSFPISTVVHANFEVSQLLWSLLLGFAMAIVGSLLPAWRAAGIQPVEAMRSRR